MTHPTWRFPGSYTNEELAARDKAAQTRRQAAIKTAATPVPVAEATPVTPPRADDKALLTAIGYTVER